MGKEKAMKQPWIKIAIACVSITIVFCGAARAYDSGSMRSESVEQQKDPGRAPDGAGAGRPEAQRLGVEQKARVASILSQYNASSLSAEDAKAINNAFRNAGIRNGPGLSEAVKAAGFDGKTISALDPPPTPPSAGPETSGMPK